VRAALILLIASHEVASMIAEENENGIVGKMLFFEHLPDSAHRSIDAFTAAVIVGQLRLPVARNWRRSCGTNAFANRSADPFGPTTRAMSF